MESIGGWFGVGSENTGGIDGATLEGRVLLTPEVGSSGSVVGTLQSGDILSHPVCVFVSLTDPVREKKDVPLGPEDPKEEDGSFDYRCVISWAPGRPRRPLSVGCPAALCRALPSEQLGLAARPLS